MEGCDRRSVKSRDTNTCVVENLEPPIKVEHDDQKDVQGCPKVTLAYNEPRFFRQSGQRIPTKLPENILKTPQTAAKRFEGILERRCCKWQSFARLKRMNVHHTDSSRYAIPV